MILQKTMCRWSNARQQLRAGVHSDNGYLLKTRGPGQQWLNSGSSPAGWFPCQRLLCLARMDDHCQAGYGHSPRAGRKRKCSSELVPVLLLQTHQFHRIGQRKGGSGRRCRRLLSQTSIICWRAKLALQETIVMRNLQFVSIADFSGFLCKVSTRQKRRSHSLCVSLLLVVVTLRSSHKPTR